MAAITDPKLLARIRKLVRGECNGYCPDQNGKAHYCIEPGSPHMEGTCSYFQDAASRCPFFEQMILPRADTPLYDGKEIDSGLGEAYSRHVQFGEQVQIRRCEWPGCRKQTAGVGPASKYCAYHAEVRRKRAAREASRRYREKAQNGPSVIKLTAESGVLPCS